MLEPWKVIICQQNKCLAEAFQEDGSVKSDYRITPDVDTLEVTQFTCPRCGTVETWGITRRTIAKTLWERSTEKLLFK